MKTKKMDYLTPAINIIRVNAEDVLTTSGGNDSKDNWAKDIFFK